MSSNHCKRICLWSGPRNVSTALMYAFNQRGDTECLDEPLYGYYLQRSGARHPGYQAVIEAMDCDGERVIRKQVLAPCARPCLFAKMMAHHLPGLNRDFLHQVHNVILTRDPREVLPSLNVQVPDPQLEDAGYAIQVQLLESLPAVTVIDARQLLLDPPGVLHQLCSRLDIAYVPAMLKWPAGAKSCDGVWSPHWYHNVHQSTGFAPYRPKLEPFPEALKAQLAQCQPLYQLLEKQALRATL